MKLLFIIFSYLTFLDSSDLILQVMKKQGWTAHERYLIGLVLSFGLFPGSEIMYFILQIRFQVEVLVSAQNGISMII